MNDHEQDLGLRAATAMKAARLFIDEADEALTEIPPHISEAQIALERAWSHAKRAEAWLEELRNQPQ
jgi:hypothetical protein